ncbi:patatin-like protein 2 [Dorcoceras hygrometricum]|uniref:Patatin-like protein 2 n=1 Tax=Dorcoceras hygrometricum TaxID=472368 RepID=A0A2Z7CBW9_9LAMI|nr:patatin-like protein 2 [Dorcoceras hygrometricum]
MPPKRREQTDKNREVDSMPELEELPADEEHLEMSVQNMVDRIEGHSHGHAIAKQPAESHEEIPEKNTVEMEEASKMMAEGILAYVKAVVSHITQSTTQGSFQHKGVEQGVGSSRAGETRRSIPTPPSLDERYTPPHQKDEAVFQRSPVMVRGNGNGNSRPHLQQPYSVTNPMIQPGLYEEGMGFPIGNTGLNADNGAYQQEKLEKCSKKKMNSRSMESVAQRKKKSAVGFEAKRNLDSAMMKSAVTSAISRELQCNQLLLEVSDSKTMSFGLIDTTAFCRAKIQQMLFAMEITNRKLQYI